MSRWLVELIGNSKDLKFLSNYLGTNELKVFRDGDIFYLESIKFDTDISINEIKIAVDNLIDVLNGAAILYYPNFQGVKYNIIHKVNDDGKKETFGFLTAPRTDYTLYAFGENDNTLLNWLKISQEDDSVVQALTLYGALDHNWKNLYMILEVIEEDLGGEEGLIKQGWVEKSELKLFKYTANNYNALGKEARHANKSWSPPPKSMSIDDAQSLSILLLREWLKFKLKKHNS